MRNLTIIFLLVAFTSCHSKKNIASLVSANANTIFSIVIELDSFDIIAEPIITTCRDSVATSFAVIAYPYLINANRGSVRAERKAVSRSDDDTLQHDYTATLLSLFGISWWLGTNARLGVATYFRSCLALDLIASLLDGIGSHD